ncbi:hypothetical protein ACAG65_03540 [Halodesulfovibrio aestuarii]|uniref:hypothetical protein n=1 Tax=Halodesulfovibrio aestuarii TaxID=126333 RepID=UPI00351FAA66
MKRLQRGLFWFLICCAAIVGCSKMLPSMFGDDAMFGEDVQERREVVYGYIFINLSSSFTKLGTVEVSWSPAITILGMSLPQYLSTTVYENDGTYYLTQWTQLGTDIYYFEPLANETAERWGNSWQRTSFTVPVNTDNNEYRQYIEYIKQQGQSLPESFAVTVYAKRFSGRIIARVLEFTPSTGASASIPQFNQLYPLVSYETVKKNEIKCDVIP